MQKIKNIKGELTMAEENSKAEFTTNKMYFDSEWVKDYGKPTLKDTQSEVSVDKRVMLNFAELNELLNEIEKLIDTLFSLPIPEELFETYSNNYMNIGQKILEMKSKISA